MVDEIMEVGTIPLQKPNKDLVIGAAVGYEWKDLRNWVNSLRKTGFSGDVVLVGTDLKKATIDKLTDEGIILQLYGNVDEKTGDITKPKNGIEPHVERFFYIWNYLYESTTDYRFVITTDVRDVVFQMNPSDFLPKLTSNVMFSLIASSEGLTYSQEPWGSANLHNTFGPFFHSILKDNPIYNVGVLAGEATTVRDLLLMIFQMSVNRPLRICDQAAYNFIINQVPYLTETNFCGHHEGWATQLGTTVEAIKAGKGDIGVNYMHDPKSLDKYLEDYHLTQPKFTDEGYVTNVDDEKFVVVHQYDRIPFLKEKIDKLYEER
jgi:hypothetical protein